MITATILEDQQGTVKNARIHAMDPDPIYDNRSLCHTYATSRREVIVARDSNKVTCVKCQHKLGKA